MAQWLYGVLLLSTKVRGSIPGRGGIAKMAVPLDLRQFKKKKKKATPPTKGFSCNPQCCLGSLNPRSQPKPTIACRHVIQEETPDGAMLTDHAPTDLCSSRLPHHRRPLDKQAYRAPQHRHRLVPRISPNTVLTTPFRQRFIQSEI